MLKYCQEASNDLPNTNFLTFCMLMQPHRNSVSTIIHSLIHSVIVPVLKWFFVLVIGHSTPQSLRSGVNDFRPSIVAVAAGNCSPFFSLEEAIVGEHLHFILGSAGVTRAGKLSLSCGLLMCQNLSREHRPRENINIQNI